MIPIYILYLLTFLGFPILGFNLSHRLNFLKNKKLLLLVIFIFLTHNIFFLFNYSIKGDYADYVVFSLEYFLFSVIVFSLSKSDKTILKICEIIGKIILTTGFIKGVFGIFFFIVISQDFVADKKYDFYFKDNKYETRRYSFGFATQMDIRYTFNTYKLMSYFPIEQFINETDLSDLKDDLDFYDDEFSIKIYEKENNQIIEFSSSDGKKVNKIINM